MPSIHIYTDEKPGHRSQLEGLVAALQARGPVQMRWIPVGAHAATKVAGPQGTQKRARPTGKPDLLLACGSRTHLPALLAKWRQRVPLVVLMKPALPSLFDLCVIPEHDQPRPAANILVTRGMLNPLRAQPDRQRQDLGLFLLGGPSRHYQWDSAAMAAQVATVVQRLPHIHWTLTTSRRTPEDCLQTIQALAVANLNLVPVTETGPGWLRDQLPRAAQVWVSEDSASMVYEGLSSGARVGILPVPCRRDNKLRRGITRLIAERRVTTLQDLTQRGEMNPGGAALTEAERVADYIHQHFLNNRT